MENRKYQRLQTKNLSVDVADGNGFFQGRVSDISRVGMCLTHLHKSLNGNEKILTILVSVEEKNFKMNVRPKWYGQGTTTKSIGVEIISVQKEWTEFVENFEPALPKDARGKSAMKKAIRAFFPKQ
jgi:hypothetical protein